MSTLGALASFLASPRRPVHPNPPDDGLARLVARAAAGSGAPPRPRLREALELVTGAPWPGRLSLLTPIEFREDSVRVGIVERGLAIRDPREAWEAAAARGLIPVAWVDDTERFFLIPEAQRSWGHTPIFLWLGADKMGESGMWQVRHLGGSTLVDPRMLPERAEPLDLILFEEVRLRPHYLLAFDRSPTILEQVVALAADAANVAAAESLAAEVVRRLGPWLWGESAMRPVRLGWEVSLTPETLLRSWQPPGTTRGAIEAVTSSCNVAQLRANRDTFGRVDAEACRMTESSPPASPFQQTVRAVLLWRELAAAGERVRPGGFAPVPPDLIGVTFADLECPLDPLLELWSLGYGLSDTVGPNMRLVAPPLRVPR